jgi:hypothetical protein
VSRQLISSPNRYAVGNSNTPHADDLLYAGSGHLSAFFSATLAFVGALLAVFDFMLAALSPAGFADIRAQAADIVCEPRSAAHKTGSRPAALRAILVEPNALGHHCDVVFAQTGVVTMFTFLSATDAGFDAGLILLVGHDILLSKTATGNLCLDPTQIRERRVNQGNYGAVFVPSENCLVLPLGGEL